MSERTEPWYVHENGDGFRLAELAVHALLTRKGVDVLVLDLRGRSDVTDYFVIASGLSDTQVNALGRGVDDDLIEAGHKPLHREGFANSKWILLDYVDVVVHVMQTRTREYYSLERLWNDAGRLDADELYFDQPDVAKRHPDLPLVRRGMAAGNRTASGNSTEEGS